MARRRNRWQPRPAPAGNLPPVPTAFTPGPGKVCDAVQLAWDAFLEDCGRKADWNRQQSETNTEGFAGTATYREAQDIAGTGWTAGRERMAAGLAVLAPADATRMGHRLDVAGAYPVAAMAAAGDMQCMVDYGTDFKPRKVHRIIVNLSASGGVPKEHIEYRGVAICAAVDAIEASDDRCEIVAHFGTSREPDALHVLITLKDADQPLEIDRLAFALGHPSMLRRLLFRQVELRRTEAQYGSGYGLPVNAPADVTEGCVYFPSMTWDNSYDTPQNALAKVKSIMAEAGVTIDGGGEL